MSKPILKQYEDDTNLMFVLKFPITVNFENDDISTYQGEYSSLIPMKREVKALKKILNFMEQDDILNEKFRDEISSLWGLYDISKGARDIFFEEAKRYHQTLKASKLEEVMKIKKCRFDVKKNNYTLEQLANLSYLCEIIDNLSDRNMLKILEETTRDSGEFAIREEEFKRFMEHTVEENKKFYGRSYIEVFAVLAFYKSLIIHKEE